MGARADEDECWPDFLIRAKQLMGSLEMKRPCHRQSPGQILVLATITMVILLGFTALAVDIGYLYSTQRRMQTAADAAAVAGATALRDGESYSGAVKL